MKIEYINLKDNNIEIPVKIFLPKNTVKKIIIACHGFGGDKESFDYHRFSRRNDFEKYSRYNI